MTYRIPIFSENTFNSSVTTAPVSLLCINVFFLSSFSSSWEYQIKKPGGNKYISFVLHILEWTANMAWHLLAHLPMKCHLLWCPVILMRHLHLLWPLSRRPNRTERDWTLHTCSGLLAVQFLLLWKTTLPLLSFKSVLITLGQRYYLWAHPYPSPWHQNSSLVRGMPVCHLS